MSLTGEKGLGEAMGGRRTQWTRRHRPGARRPWSPAAAGLALVAALALLSLNRINAGPARVESSSPALVAGAAEPAQPVLAQPTVVAAVPATTVAIAPVTTSTRAPVRPATARRSPAAPPAVPSIAAPLVATTAPHAVVTTTTPVPTAVGPTAVVPTVAACRNSTDPSCGPFRFDPQPGPDRPMTVQVVASPAAPAVGQPMVFRVTLSDPDGVSYGSSMFGFGDSGIGETSTDPCTRFGPWDPPALNPGGAVEVLDISHTYFGAGTYTASFAFDAGPFDCTDAVTGRGDRPYASSATGSLTVVIG